MTTLYVTWSYNDEHTLEMADHNVFVEHEFFVLSLNMPGLNVMECPLTLAHYVGCVAMLALGRFTGAT
jgi:hypothetical protein